MKKARLVRQGAALLLGCVAVVLGGCPGSVYFPDNNLELAVRDSLHQPLFSLTDSDLLEVTEVNAAGWGVRNLAGLEFCAELKRLDLSNNQVSSLTPLKNLILLEYLNLKNNQVSDIADLSGLKSLRYIDLSGNEISSFRPLVTNAQSGGIKEGCVLIITAAGNLDSAGKPTAAFSADYYALKNEGVDVRAATTAATTAR